MSRGRRAPLALLLTTLVIGAPALAHDAPPADEEFIKGVFTPSFVPPPPGSYELPVVAKVAPVVVRDTAGRRVSTSAVTEG